MRDVVFHKTVTLNFQLFSYTVSHIVQDNFAFPFVLLEFKNSQNDITKRISMMSHKNSRIQSFINSPDFKYISFLFIKKLFLIFFTNNKCIYIKIIHGFIIIQLMRRLIKINKLSNYLLLYSTFPELCSKLLL